MTRWLLFTPAMAVRPVLAPIYLSQYPREESNSKSIRLISVHGICAMQPLQSSFFSLFSIVCYFLVVVIIIQINQSNQNRKSTFGAQSLVM